MSYELIELPEGWAWTLFEEITTNHDGKRVPVSGTERKFMQGSFPYYGASGIIDYVDKYLFEGKYLLIAEDGANLLSRSTPIAFKAEGKFWVNNHAHVLQVHDDIVLLSYLRDYINYLDIRFYISGSAQPKLNQKNLNRIEILLPPLNEQKRIVAKIEALRERSRRAREALFEIPGLCDRFRQSVLAAAFRGDLTADWRKQNPHIEPAHFLLKHTSEQLKLNFDEPSQKSNEKVLIPDTWTWAKLKQFIKRIQAGKNFTCPEIPVNEDTVGLVKISAVTWGKFDSKETKTVADVSKIEPNLFIKKGDFLISRANTIELVGASVVVEEINYKIMLSDKVWRVDFLEVDKKFINFYLKSNYGRKEIESRATGNQLSMRNISQEAFRDIVIPLPPLKEQWEIVRQIEVSFKAIDQVEQQYQEAKAYLDQLDQSILAKAFRGELVPQDPNDEPASVLLERIKAEREQLGEKKKTTRKSPAPRSRKAKTETPTFEQMTIPGLEIPHNRNEQTQK